MQRRDNQLIFSPSDLTRFIAAELVTWLDRLYLEQPDALVPDEDTQSEALFKNKGLAHEDSFLLSLKEKGYEVVDVSSADDRFAATRDAMRAGTAVIYQAALGDGQFIGYADFLFRVEGSSDLGDYHYEPWDTKLASRAKPYFLLQLSCYADLLRTVQGVLPKHLHVLLGSGEQFTVRTEDYYFYYLQMRKAFLEQQSSWSPVLRPELANIKTVDFGRWTSHVKGLIEQEDHLCQVANIRSVQIKKLRAAGIETMTGLIESQLLSVPKMKPAVFATLQRQARLQQQSLGLEKPLFELLPDNGEKRGLRSLPPHSVQDVYFDMEGYPLVEGGLEYLFGATTEENGTAAFFDWWAHNPKEEREAFENFIDWVFERWQTDKKMHVYHYAAYEKTALRKLMSKHNTRADKLDELLRNEVFVDLFAVVRQALMVGEPNYSLKSIEHLYKGRRSGDVSTAIDSVVFYQNWLDQQDGGDWRTSSILGEIRAYNKEDCDSTLMLAKWLRELQNASGVTWLGEPADVPASPEPGAEPEPGTESQSAGSGREPPGEPKREVSNSARARSQAAKLAEQMLDTAAAKQAVSSQQAQTVEEQARIQELLGHLLEFHWRETKPVFWAQFDRQEMSEEELFEDVNCLSGLERTDAPAKKTGRRYQYQYSFDPEQDTKIESDDTCLYTSDLKDTVKVEEIDQDRGLIWLSVKSGAPALPLRLNLIKSEFVSTKPLSDSIYRTASRFMKDGTLPEALSHFLLRKRPALREDERDGCAAASPSLKSDNLIDPEQDLVMQTASIVSRLDNSSLCIQGPPGSGKTYAAAFAIVDLLAAGKIVGIASNSHKAINNLLEETVAQARARGLNDLRAAKVKGSEKAAAVHSPHIEVIQAKDLFSSTGPTVQLIGATAWTFAREEAEGMLDYLFVDEAGQVSLANLVAMAPSARNLVLIGDQMQLSQPIKATHPADSGQSIMEYLLRTHQVIPPDLGIFLGTTRRMHPQICRFISSAIYEDRLTSHPDTARRVLSPPARSAEPSTNGRLKQSGVIYVPVEHEGNAQDSEEEVSAIADLVEELIGWSICDGDAARPLNRSDILIVAPYNMQVRRLQAALPHLRIGTVDKFQGQEAAVVIISMCSSSGDAPARGLEFIFSKNRLNVAISRAQSLALVVGNPALARSHCQTVEQMELVNLFCRIVSHEI